MPVPVGWSAQLPMSAPWPSTAKGQPSLLADSDSDEGLPIGLPGDRDEKDPPAPQQAEAEQEAEAEASPKPVPQAVGFDIDIYNFGGSFDASRPAKTGPSDALIARLARKTNREAGRQRRKRESEGRAQQREKRANARQRRAARGVSETRDARGTSETRGEEEEGEEAAPSCQPASGPIGVGVGIEDQETPEVLVAPDELSATEKVDFKSQVALFGEMLVRKVRSSKWQHRVEGLKELQSSLRSFPVGRHKPKVLELVAGVLAWTIGDSVLHVFKQTVALWNHLLTDYVMDMEPTDVTSKFKPPTRLAVARLGDTNGRVRDLTQQLLLSLARHPRIGPEFVGSFATGGAPGSLSASIESVASDRAVGSGQSGGDDCSPDRVPCPGLVTACGGGSSAVRAAGGAGWKLAIGKLGLAMALVQEHNLADAGPLGVGAVMGMAAEALNIPNAKVRKTASALVVEVYKREGKTCEAYLVDVSAAALKLLKQEIEIEICDVSALEAAESKGQEEDDLANLEPELRMSEAQRERLLRWQALLGDRSLVCLLSRKWKLRDNVFSRLRTRLEAILEAPPSQDTGGATLFDPENSQLTRAAFEALVQVAEVGLHDSIPTLLVSCCHFLRPVMELYQRYLPAEEIRGLLHPILGRVVNQVSHGTTATVQACLDLLQFLANQPKVGVTFLSEFLTECDPEQEKHWKVLLARLRVLLALIPAHGFGETNMPIDRVMSFTVSCFQSPSGKVRSVAVQVIIEAYKKCGNGIRIYLRNQKPVLLQELKEKLAKVARKERTKSAPVHTLASIVQPLGVEDELDRVMPGRPSTFPTFEAEATPAEALPLRERVAQWRREGNPVPVQETAGTPNWPPMSGMPQPGPLRPVVTLRDPGVARGGGMSAVLSAASGSVTGSKLIFS